MLFKKKYIKCCGYCSEKHVQYISDEYGKNKYLYIIEIIILEPDYLKSKVVHYIDDKYLDIEINQNLYINFNDNTGDVQIISIKK